MKRNYYGVRNFRFRYFRIHKSVTRKEFYKLVFIISTFATVYSSYTRTLFCGLPYIATTNIGTRVNNGAVNQLCFVPVPESHWY